MRTRHARGVVFASVAIVIMGFAVLLAVFMPLLTYFKCGMFLTLFISLGCAARAWTGRDSRVVRRAATPTFDRHVVVKLS